jgi:hypothetical protein
MPRVGYRRLIKIALGISIVTCAGGLLWLVGGAGIYGSPVAGAFERDRLDGYLNHWQFWIFWVVVAGPIALLPGVLLERAFPRAGACTLIGAGLFVAEAGIRASRVYVGFSDEDALIVIGCIATPMLLLATLFLVLSVSRISLGGLIAGILALCIIGGVISFRYKTVRDYWNENCPRSLESSHGKARELKGSHLLEVAVGQNDLFCHHPSLTPAPRSSTTPSTASGSQRSGDTSAITASRVPRPSGISR